MREKLSYLLKWATVLSALGGVLLSLVSARSHGYSHWSKRLLYFTAQSNLWIGLTTLAILLLPLCKLKKQEKWKKFLYVGKYAFTVSIAMTCLVFCGFLAPFADESYHVWAFSSFLTHIFSPLFAIADFFTDPYRVPLKNYQAVLALLPPLFYFAPVILMCAFGVDFGRGVAYPYYFLDFRSPLGFFGVSKHLPALGSVYWILLFTITMVALSLVFVWLNGKLYTKKCRRV